MKWITFHLVTVASLKGWGILCSKWAVGSQSWRVGSRKMGERKGVSDFDNGQIITSRRLGQYISKTAALVGFLTWVQWIVPIKCGPWKHLGQGSSCPVSAGSIHGLCCCHIFEWLHDLDNCISSQVFRLKWTVCMYVYVCNCLINYMLVFTLDLLSDYQS